MANYKTPGVYIEEISLLPPSVAQVETAIPAFIGYTAKGEINSPTRLRSMVEFENIFGGPAKELPKFVVENSSGSNKIFMDEGTGNVEVKISPTPFYRLYYGMQMYFANGGGPCYVVSAGHYPEGNPAVDKQEMSNALNSLRKEDEPTLILFPDAGNLDSDSEYHGLLGEALQQCADLQDRFTVCDVLPTDDTVDPIGSAAKKFRDNIGNRNLKYGATYFPPLKTTLNYSYQESSVAVNNLGTDIQLRYTEEEIKEEEEKILEAGGSEEDAKNKRDELIEKSLFHQNNETYFEIRKLIDSVRLELPPSSAMVGIYAAVDSDRGVWKAPANVSINWVIKPTIFINDADQRDLNVHTSGISINAIRFFTGKGVLVWGARTLAGNDNEWRYISVRRFFNMVEESVKKASERFVFEPNDANTWVKVKAMIENFLTLQWRAGALMGASTDQAFFVKVGLGETMTSLDVLEGRMIIEIGMAVVRPAEFIILRFSHKMIEG